MNRAGTAYLQLCVVGKEYQETSSILIFLAKIPSLGRCKQHLPSLSIVSVIDQDATTSKFTLENLSLLGLLKEKWARDMGRRIGGQ